MDYNDITSLENAQLKALNAELTAQAEKEVKKQKAFRIFGWLAIAGSVVAAIYCGKKLKDVCGVVNSAVTDVSALTYIDVQQAVVDRAVEKAAQNAAGKAVRATESLIRDRVETAVCNAVADSKGAIKASVTAKIAKEVAEIDKSELIEDITEKAKELIVEKFDGKLDGIAADYSRNLENVGKIYQSIAETMQKKA